MTFTALRARRGAGPRRWLWSSVALYGSFGLLFGCGASGEMTGSVPPGTVTVLGIVLYSITGLGLAVRASRHPRLARRTRQAWRVVSASFILLLAVPVLLVISNRTVFPTPGDLARLAFMPTLLAALLMFPLRSASRNERRKIMLDVATVVASCFMVLWYLVLGPRLAAPGGVSASVLTAAAFPVGDLALIFGVALIMLRGADLSARRPLSLMAASVGIFVVEDVYVGYGQSHPSSTEHQAWQFVALLVAHFLLAAAAFEQCRLAGVHELQTERRPRVRAAGRLPYAAVGMAYALMTVAAALEEHPYPWFGLVAGGALITGLVLIRQVMLQRESHALAVTDSLTGLANRPCLHEALARALARGERSHQLTAVVLVDMDGFKQVNDAMGHRAGDQLLVAFGDILRRNVLGSDLVGRLGGDEFAMLLHNIGGRENAEAVVRRVRSEMDQPVLIDGTLIAPRASFGIAVSEPGELGTDELLHRADVAMYRAKRRNTTGWEVYDEAHTEAR